MKITKENLFYYAVAAFLALAIFLFTTIGIYEKTPRKLSYYEKRYDKVELTSLEHISSLKMKNYMYYATFLEIDSTYSEIIGMWLLDVQLPEYRIGKQDFKKAKWVYIEAPKYKEPFERVTNGRKHTVYEVVDTASYDKVMNRYKFALVSNDGDEMKTLVTYR